MKRVFVLLILLCLLTAAGAGCAELSAGRQNIVARAYRMTDVEWTPLKTIRGWHNAYTYEAWVTYRGIPYGQPYAGGTYIPYAATVGDFLLAVQDPDSLIYTAQGLGDSICPYYAADCSSFLSYCYDTERLTTAIIDRSNLFDNVPYLDHALPGDCLNKADVHAVLITDIRGSGTSAEYEICHLTDPLARREVLTWARLMRRYVDNGYQVKRFRGADNVPPPEPLPELTGSTLRLPEGITVVEAEAFRGCGMTAVTLPASCLTVGSRAFADCPRLMRITVLNPDCDIAPDAFGNAAPVIIRAE